MPYIADSISDKQIFMSAACLQTHVGAGGAGRSFYLVTLGQCDEYSLLFRHRLLSGIELQELASGRRLPDCMGKFFDADDRGRSSELNQRTLADLTLAHL